MSEDRAKKSVADLNIITARIIKGYEMRNIASTKPSYPSRYDTAVTRLVVELSGISSPYDISKEEKERILSLLDVDEDVTKVIWVTPLSLSTKQLKHGWLLYFHDGLGYFCFEANGNTISREWTYNPKTKRTVYLRGSKPDAKIEMRAQREQEAKLDTIGTIILLLLSILGLIWWFSR